MHTDRMNCLLFKEVYGCILKLVDGLSVPYEKMKWALKFQAQMKWALKFQQL